MVQGRVLNTYDGPLADYGFGSWLGRNIGNIAQTVGGAALMFIPGGQVAGAGMLANSVGGYAGDATNQSANAQQEAVNKRNALIQQRLAAMAYGGSMEETGTFAPQSLVPLNSPFYTVKKNGGGLPRGSATLAEAKEYMKLYPEEMALGEKVEHEHTGNKTLARRISADHIKDFMKMTGSPMYYSTLKESGISDELNKMALGGFFDLKNGGIYIKPSKRGTFTTWAKKHGMSVKEAASRVMAHKENYSPAIVKKANFAKNFAHADGGPIDGGQMNYGQLPQLLAMAQAKKKDGGLIDNKFAQLPSVTYANGGVFNDTINGNKNILYTYNDGGPMLTEYSGGGTHDQNPRGGIPVGKKARVEEGEYRFDDPETGESYIFSNRF